MIFNCKSDFRCCPAQNWFNPEQGQRFLCPYYAPDITGSLVSSGQSFVERWEKYKLSWRSQTRDRVHSVLPPSTSPRVPYPKPLQPRGRTSRPSHPLPSPFYINRPFQPALLVLNCPLGPFVLSPLCLFLSSLPTPASHDSVQSRLFQMPLAVLALISTIKSFSWIIPRRAMSSFSFTNYHSWRNVRKLREGEKKPFKIWRVDMT